MKTISATAGWICGRCRRRVPHYVAVCRCGLARFGEQLTDESVDESPKAGSSSLGKAAPAAPRAARSGLGKFKEYFHITHNA